MKIHYYITSQIKAAYCCLNTKMQMEIEDVFIDIFRRLLFGTDKVGKIGGKQKKGNLTYQKYLKLNLVDCQTTKFMVWFS